MSGALGPKLQLVKRPSEVSSVSAPWWFLGFAILGTTLFFYFGYHGIKLQLGFWTTIPVTEAGNFKASNQTKQKKAIFKEIKF